MNDPLLGIVVGRLEEMRFQIDRLIEQVEHLDAVRHSQQAKLHPTQTGERNGFHRSGTLALALSEEPPSRAKRGDVTAAVRGFIERRTEEDSFTLGDVIAGCDGPLKPESVKTAIRSLLVDGTIHRRSKAGGETTYAKGRHPNSGVPNRGPEGDAAVGRFIELLNGGDEFKVGDVIQAAAGAATDQQLRSAIHRAVVDGRIEVLNGGGGRGKPTIYRRKEAIDEGQ